MVPNEILARTSQIHRVPVLKLVSQLLKGLLWNGAALWILSLEEDVVPYLRSHVLRLDVQRTLAHSMETSSSEEM
jgi:hypothetical protein